MKFILFFIFRILLYPIILLLNLIILVRNWLYDHQILKSITPTVFTINVGNLNVGGTGKTPHVEYLVRLLADTYKLTTLSRGYKRKTKGFILANENATAATIGDEPLQYFLKFKDKINVAVCEKRIIGVNEIQTRFPQNQLIILDDAFQHRKIAPHLNLLLCDYNRPFYNDALVPFGRLRDLKQSAIRANAIIVTKCPKEIPYSTFKEIIEGIQKYTSDKTPIFFSRINYKPVTGYSIKAALKSKQQVNIVTGIASPEQLIKYLTDKQYKINQEFTFPDHHNFSRKDIENILNKTSKQDTSPQIITTEKDMVKLKPLLKENERSYFFYIPIEVEIENKHEFDKFTLESIKSFFSKNT